NFGGGEVGIDDESGPLAHQRLVARLFQLLAERRGATVLPDNGLVDGAPRASIPDYSGLALVGDTNARHLLRCHASLRQCRATDLQGDTPDLLSVMFNPATGGIMLGELLL